MCTPVMPYRPGFFAVDRALNSCFMIMIMTMMMMMMMMMLCNVM